MAISDQERHTFERVLAEVGKDQETAEVACKVFFHVIQKAAPLSKPLQQKLEQLAFMHDEGKSSNKWQEELQQLGSMMIDVAEETESVKSYTTGQLAKLFGVSVTTVNNWIAAGRLKGIERTERNKQARIPENTVWISSTEEPFLIREVAAAYGRREQTAEETAGLENSKQEERLAIIQGYEKRYGKMYEDVVQEKGDPAAEQDDWKWAREGKEWKLLLDEVKRDDR